MTSRLQRFFTAIFPRAWSEAMEASSRAWKVRCPCGAETSIWELGGIRWKARGDASWPRRCATCGERTWHKIVRDPV